MIKPMYSFSLVNILKGVIIKQCTNLICQDIFPL